MKQATKNLIAVSLALVGLLLMFQNCSFKPTSHGQARPTQETLSGGQPYDGKPYIIGDKCSDGTLVKSRLVLKGDFGGDGGILYRDDCVTDSPKVIGASQIQIRSDEPNRLQFDGRTFIAERPAIPLPGLISWYYQLQGPLQDRAPGIYIIDMFDNTAATIQNLKAAGHTVICTISAGTVEGWRTDANSFSTSDIGRSVSGASDERWLDTRSLNVRRVMLARLDLAKSKGCHGIDFDGVDGYDNNTGFPLSAATQLEYNQYLAFAAHDRELILSLNNVPNLAADLSNVFDFAIAEQCYQFNECEKYSSFVQRGKPVLAAEYTNYSEAQCRSSKEMQFSLVYLNRELDGSRFESCFQ